MHPFTHTEVSLNDVTMTLVTNLEDNITGAEFRSGKKLWSDALDHARKVLKRKDRILYAGGHIGSAAIFLAKVEPTAMIYCFEPDPVNYSLLTMNLVINQVRNVHAFPFAAGKKQGFIPFYKSDWDSSDHRCAMPRLDDADVSIFHGIPYHIPMVQPPEFLKESYRNQAPDSFDLIVTDTQGADFDILEACLPMIGPHTSVIAEYSPYHLYRHGTSKQQVERLLRLFSRAEIVNSLVEDVKPAPVTVDSLLSFYDDHCKQYSGYVDIWLTSHPGPSRK
ncbi:FkbM family methyltransferase [Brevibacillus sp. WF146]|jgi:FkbM family methyltransferase|uniref:FkbM family methyltransferase n=2 Tax=Bacteria TaxID=2 RepID=UPI0007EC7235|nr:FkbM family methyltransferase [Brevibacillus sp. WF146]UYZ12482.1 FkbM family methyltransferase [Brevibacillus sp. WF146]